MNYNMELEEPKARFFRSEIGCTEATELQTIHSTLRELIHKPTLSSLFHRARAAPGYPSCMHGAPYWGVCATNIQIAWCMCSGGTVAILRPCNQVISICSALRPSSDLFNCTLALPFQKSRVEGLIVLKSVHRVVVRLESLLAMSLLLVLSTGLFLLYVSMRRNNEYFALLTGHEDLSHYRLQPFLPPPCPFTWPILMPCVLFSILLSCDQAWSPRLVLAIVSIVRR